jgi:hypothetical protein
MGKAVEILSNFEVRNLGPGLHRDGGGLVLVVDAGGSRNWGFVYREPYTKDKFGNGKRTKLGLGGYAKPVLPQKGISTWTPAPMLHHTTTPWSPERMRRLIFSLIRSSTKAANRLKPINFGISSSQSGWSLASYP